MAKLAVHAEDVSKSFRIYEDRATSVKHAVVRGQRAKYQTFWALHGVSFEVPRGSTFGLIGVNGSGKSTMLKCIARILVPNAGSVTTWGKVSSLLELGTGFHPDLTGRENVYLNASILGISKSEIHARIATIADFAAIGTFFDSPVRTYSSGMYMRLGFAVAANIDPDVLIVDEVLTVGDATFQDRCLEKFAELRRQGRTVVMASHALGPMGTMCDEVVQLDRGHVVDAGAPVLVFPQYAAAAAGATPEASAAGSVTITDVEVIDDGGFPVERLRTGDAVIFRIHYRADEPVERPVFTVALDTTAGVRAWARHSRDARAVPDVVSGVGSIDLVVAALQLQAGTYGLAASVVDDALLTTYDFDPRGYCLTVFNDDAAPEGIAVLRSRWAAPVPALEHGQDVG